MYIVLCQKRILKFHLGSHVNKLILFFFFAVCTSGSYYHQEQLPPGLIFNLIIDVLMYVLALPFILVFSKVSMKTMTLG